MQLQKILSKIQFVKIINQQEIEITSIHYNSAECKNNSLFVAIKGDNADGNNYIPDAIKKGAKVIITSDLYAKIIKEITYIFVEDERKTLAKLSHLFYDDPTKELVCIGITGTNGKTTTTSLIKSVLETAGKKVGMIGTTGVFYNEKKIETNHTTPESLELAKIIRKMVDEGVEYLVMEVSSHSIVQQRVTEIPFKVAAFTNLTHEHIDFHKTYEEYALAKKKLFDNLSKDCIAVINMDDSFSEYMVSDCKGIIKKVGENTNDYMITGVSIEKAQSSFTLNNTPVKTKLTAYFNIQNAALSYAICNELGIDKKYIIEGLSNSNGAPGRLQSVIIKNGATAFVDYAHTPDALEKALLSCKKLVNDGRLICLFGCGGDRDKTKRPIMGKIAEKEADIVIITDDNPRTEDSSSIINDIMEGIENKKNIKVIANRGEAIKIAKNISSKNDIILVAGKGHEEYQIIGNNKYHFSDLEELLK